MRRPVVGLALAMACAAAHEAESTEVAQVALAAWSEAGLPEPSEACRLDRLATRFPETMEAYLTVCPPDSWACLAWRSPGPSWPVVVISPKASAESVARLAVHEGLHAAGYCTGIWKDGYDYNHADPRVWGGGEYSAEAVARRLLDGD